jgi:anti-anti-sigma factor
MKNGLSVRVERKGGQSAQVVLDGSVDAHSFERFSDMMTELTEADTLWIVLDLRTLNYIASVGISFLINLRVERRKAGGEVILVGPQPSVHKILKMLGLLEVLVVVRTLEEAWSQISPKLQASASGESGDLPLIE